MAFSFKTNELIDNYKVVFALKEDDYAQNYRVKDSKGDNYFLKLINPQSLHHTQIDSKGNILEIEIAKQLYDNNTVEYVGTNTIISQAKNYQYIVYKYISGQTLSEYPLQEDFCSIAMAKNFIIQILKGLRFLHSRPQPIIHNELTLDNIMLDFRTGIPNCRIIDFGYARYLSQGINDCQISISNIFFQPIEMLNDVFSKQSDLYSVGVLLYYLIFGNLPYLVDLSDLDKQPKALIDYLTPIRQKPPKFRVINNRHFDEQLINIICKALAFDIEDRFLNADQFIDALNNNIQITVPRPKETETNDIHFSKPSGNGFKDVTGLEDLKAKLQSEVIDLINSPERAKQLGLHIPNGILFFGPPGCGKTFFAEKFASKQDLIINISNALT